MTAGKTKPGDGTDNPVVTLVPAADEQASGVLRWRAGPAPIAEMVLADFPRIVEELCGHLGCRVLFGPTEDLTGCILRVYADGRSLAMFPRNQADLSEILKWAMGPTVLQDIAQYGDEVAEVERRRKRR